VSETSTANASTPAVAGTQAIQFMHSRVLEPVFFHKLAEHGVVPRSDRERNQLLKMGNQLFRAYQEELAKQASVSPSLIDIAASELDQLCGPDPGTEDAFAKEATVAAMAHEDIRDTALYLVRAFRQAQ